MISRICGLYCLPSADVKPNDPDDQFVKRVMVCVHVELGFTCGWHDCSSGWQGAWLLCVV